jgi:hypothetical protein
LHLKLSNLKKTIKVDFKLNHINSDTFLLLEQASYSQSSSKINTIKEAVGGGI